MQPPKRASSRTEKNISFCSLFCVRKRTRPPHARPCNFSIFNTSVHFWLKSHHYTNESLLVLLYLRSSICCRRPSSFLLTHLIIKMSSIHSESSLLMSRVLHQKDSSFDPRVFWSINALLITLLLIVLVWCFRGGAEKISNYLTREAAGSSDAIYLERLRERRERAAEEKKETPEQRLAKLKKSFQRNKVHMVSTNNAF